MFVVLPGSAGLVNVSVASPPSTAISGYLTHQAERSARQLTTSPEIWCLPGKLTVLTCINYRPWQMLMLEDVGR